MTQESPNFDANLGKAVDLPQGEEMLKRLQEAGIYGITPQTDAFYQRLATSIGGSSKVGAGLNMAWELAGYDTLRGLPSIVRAAVDMNFDKAIDAITPDPEVAEEAKEYRRKVLEEVAKQRKAVEPTPEALGPADQLDNLDRYAQAHKVADLVFGYVDRRYSPSSNRPNMEDWRQEKINPFYSQTHRGFFLEAYYGQLSKLHTPWGLYGFGGSGGGSWHDVEGEILGRLGATVHKEERNTEMGTIGPIYTVRKIDEIVLPEPIERPRSQYVPYEDVNKALQSLTSQYKAQQGKK